MIFTGLLSFLVWMLTIVGLGGASQENSNVVNCAWAVSTATDDQGKSVTNYYGLKRWVVRNEDSGALHGTRWVLCDGNDAEYCNECKVGGQHALNALALSFILASLTVICTFLRTSKKSDFATTKIILIIFVSFELLMNMISMGAFGKQCYQELPTDVEPYWGPGFGAVTCCFVFNLFLLVIHSMTPVRPVEKQLAQSEQQADDAHDDIEDENQA